MFLVSDVFDPSLAGAAGVGITGAYVADGGGNIAFASTQARMNYLLTPVGGFAAPINNNAAILAETPEPGTVFLVGSALLGIGMMSKRG